MVDPTCFGITLPSSGSVHSAFWEMLNWGVVDRILWMGVLCLVTWYVATWDRHAPINYNILNFKCALKINPPYPSALLHAPSGITYRILTFCPESDFVCFVWPHIKQLLFFSVRLPVAFYNLGRMRFAR
jgi:hypothetical protein